MSLTPETVDDLAESIGRLRAVAPNSLIQITDRFVENFNALMPGAQAQQQAMGVMLLAVVGCVLEDYRGDGGLAEVLTFAPGITDFEPELKDVLPLALAMAGQQLYQEGASR